MQKNAFSASVLELAGTDPKAWPHELVSHAHLIYSSPAALSFNSPGAKGFGVKRAALTIPDSVMLLFSPACCGRNTSAVGGAYSRYADRMYYLLLNETDIVTGRYIRRIVTACEEIMRSRTRRPSCIMLCSTCVDALLGTDMDRVTRMVEDACGLPCLSATMYALTREGHLPPMVLVRRTLYSLLRKRPKKSTVANILGFFTRLSDSSELYTLLKDVGLTQINEIGRMTDMEQYQSLAEANFNLVLYPESRYAADYLQRTLAIPFIELYRTYQLDRIQKQYDLLGQILRVRFRTEPFHEQAGEEERRFRKEASHMNFAVGETANCDSFDLALSLLRCGARVSAIFSDPQPQNRPQLKAIAALSPGTRVFSNLSPTMLAYDPHGYAAPLTHTIGVDAGYYHPDIPNIPWNTDDQPFGFDGLERLLRSILQAGTERTGETEKDTETDSRRTGDERPTATERTGATEISGVQTETGQERESETSPLIGTDASGRSQKQDRTRQSLLLHLSPFAPDSSGAVQALYEMGGLLVVCDAGGCTGNICGFDEPRWEEKHCALFSAGLRDMDAILGRDDRLLEKTALATQATDAPFVAIIGTPVPAVIGTDFQGLARLGRKKLGRPCLTVQTTGTRHYDQGYASAMRALAEQFLTPPGHDPASDLAPDKGHTQEHSHRMSAGEISERHGVSVLGASPMDICATSADALRDGLTDILKDILQDTSQEHLHEQTEDQTDLTDSAASRDTVLIQGMGAGLTEFCRLPFMRLNLVVAPSGHALALFCRERFGTPFRIIYPVRSIPVSAEEILACCGPSPSVCILHQQVLADSLRKEIRRQCPDARVTVATFFSEIAELREEQDRHITTETELKALLDEPFDVIVGDSLCRRVQGTQGKAGQTGEHRARWIDLPHSAASGRLFSERDS